MAAADVAVRGDIERRRHGNADRQIGPAGMQSNLHSSRPRHASRREDERRHTKSQTPTRGEKTNGMPKRQSRSGERKGSPRRAATTRPATRVTNGTRRAHSGSSGRQGRSSKHSSSRQKSGSSKRQARSPRYSRSRSRCRDRRRRSRTPESDADFPQEADFLQATYPPLLARLQRIRVLKDSDRWRGTRKRFTKKLLLGLGHWSGCEGMKSAPSTLPSPNRALSSSPSAIRFVAISDTHRLHDLVDVPKGEVLLHGGDWVANYGREYELMKHMDEFIAWLRERCKTFALVIFIAGNHETFLDPQHNDVERLETAKAKLNAFLSEVSNCVYLDHSSFEYKGLRLFGSSVMTSRIESEKKRYVSRAFERTEAERKVFWSNIPEGLDVLLTHSPPRGELGDLLLKKRLEGLAEPPRYHVFGHAHEGLGFETPDEKSGTIFINAAQEKYLRVDEKGGGCAMIFDVERRNFK